ncbi:ABC transporter substrate-binding protein [Alicyclobacillus fastidiosus]|uniref:ABC transporter substrate-binding protein n=1 Tax=Alicyclobacillus fastidiosus TaxID=392011 RepID=UPI0023EA32BF|nr:ABC transporter substrate-binding protein [Alicyclobacillus fastidiosus]GMA66343.1 hypothetical protein GCM10025859_67850 [Alicyclobacillus fastidiosus]
MDPEKLGVKANNDKELEIQLEKPVPYFTSLMTFPPFFPQNEEFVEEYGKEYGNDSEKILSNGAFTMENWDQSSMEWDLEKNPEYYDADKVKLEKVNVDVIKETATAFNLFQSDELDQAEISGEHVKQNEDNPNLQKVPDSKVFYFKMNQNQTIRILFLLMKMFAELLLMRLIKKVLLTMYWRMVLALAMVTFQKIL